MRLIPRTTEGYLVYTLIVTTLVVGAGITLFFVNNPRPTPAQPTTLTIVESSTMLDQGATAIGTTPTGEKVFVLGDWIAGDTITGYPQAREGQPGAAPTFDPDSGDPADTAWRFSMINHIGASTVIGVFLAALIMLTAVRFADWRTERKQAQQRESERIVNAAISDPGLSRWIPGT